jgi:hypothetical protein
LVLIVYEAIVALEITNAYGKGDFMLPLPRDGEYILEKVF